MLTGHGGNPSISIRRMLQPQRMSCCLLNIAYRSVGIACKESAIPHTITGTTNWDL